MQAKRRYELTDAQWARLEPLLPPEKPWTGRPNDDHRQILNGILWVLNSGAPWRDLPRRYGPVGPVSSRFYRWRRAGVWHRVLEALQALADAEGRVGWELHFLDSTVVRAHQHAAGARKAGREPGDEALGRSRGGFTTKIHVRCEGYGKPVTFALTGGRGRGGGALGGGLHGQDPWALGGLRQAGPLRADRWPGARQPAGDRPDRPRRDPPHRPGPVAPAAGQAGWRQSLQQPEHPASPA